MSAEGKRKLQAWLRKKSAPTTQLHKTLYALACLCRDAGYSQDQTEVIVKAYAAGGKGNRNVPEREALSAVNSAFKAPSRSSIRWPEPLPALMAECDRYPQPVPYPVHQGESPEFFLAKMFPGNPLLCCGMAAWAMDTRTLEDWRGMLKPMQFVVPSPMIAVEGARKEDGRESFHAESNTGARKYLVTEFDGPDKPQQMARIASLKALGTLSLAVLVDSAGKSLHAYWHANASESVNRDFFEHACKLGADDRLWLRSQFARMPGGTRERRRQEVLFFDL
jgi:hypothetical protein